MELGNLELGLTLNHEQLKTELAGLENKIAKQVKAIKIPVSVNVTVNASSTGVNIATTGQSINTLGIINQLRNGTKEIKSTIVASSSLFRNVNTSLNKIENNLTKIEKIFSSAVRQFKFNTFFSILKTVGGGALKTVSKIAFAPITIPFNLVKGLLADISKGISTNIGMPLGVEIGRLLTKKSPLGKVKTIVAKVLKGFEVLDQEIIGKETVYETFLAELIKSGNIQKAVTASFARTSLAKVTTRLGLLQRLSGIGDLIAPEGEDIVEKRIEFFEKILEDARKVDKEFVVIYDELIKEMNISPSTQPKIVKAKKLKVAEQLLAKAQPKDFVTKVINPLIDQVQPLLLFIQGMQAYNTSKLSQQFYQMKKPTFPILREGEDVVSVIGGAESKAGRGSVQKAPALETVLPGRIVLPVQNPDTDTTERSKEMDQVFTDVVAKLKEFGVELDDGVLPTIRNLVRQVTFAFNPKADSAAAAESLAYTRLAEEQGRKGSVLSFSLGGADAYRYARSAEYMGVPTKTLAMAYPFLNPSKYVPKGFQAALLEKDPLGFPFDLGLGSGTSAFHRLPSDVKTGSADVHGLHHLFKAPGFPQLLGETTGTAPLVADTPQQRKALAHFMSVGLELEEALKAVESTSAMMAVGKIDLGHIPSVLKGVSEARSLSAFSSMPGMPEIQAALSDVFETARDNIIKFFADQDVAIPELSELPGFVAFNKEVEGWATTLESFRTGIKVGELEGGWHAAEFDIEKMKERNRQLTTETYVYFKKKAPEFGQYGPKILDFIQMINKVQTEFIKTKGKLSQTTKDSISAFLLKQQVEAPDISAGYSIYKSKIGELVQTLESFRSGKDTGAWFAGNLDPQAVGDRPIQGFLDWAKGEQSNWGKWGDELVKVLEEIKKVQEEFVRTNGQLSQEFKEQILSVALPKSKDEMSRVAASFDETFPDNDYRRFLPENRQLAQISAPQLLKQQPASILAYNAMLKALGSIMPSPESFKAIGYGMSGATAMMTDELVYKTDLDPEGQAKIASKNEIEAYKKLQGRLSPILYEAKQGEALVTERIKGVSLKQILDRIALPIKTMQESLLKETDPAKQATLKAKIQREITRFNRVADKLYGKVGQLGGAMQQMGVAHGDLAASNVYFTKKGITSIDLGNAIANPTKQQKQMDYMTTMQRAVIDRTYAGIMNMFQVAKAITKGYKTPLAIPETRQPDTSLLTPEQQGKEIPIGIPASTYIEQFIPNIQQLLEGLPREGMSTEESTQQIVSAVQEVSATIKEIPLVPLEAVKELEPVELTPPKQSKAQLLSLPEYPSVPTLPAEIEESSSTLEQVRKQAEKRVKAQLTPPSSSVDLVKLEAQLKKEKNQLARINLLPLSDEVKKGLLARQKGFNDLHRKFTESLKKGDFSQAKVLAKALKEYGDKNSQHFDIYKKAIAELESQGIKTGVSDLGGDIQSLKAGITKKGQAKGIDQQIATAERRYLDKLVKEAKKAKKAGRDIGEGLAEGISESLDIVEQSAIDLANTTVETTKDELDIQSPSRVFIEMGKNIGKGLVKGVELTGGLVKKAFDVITFKKQRDEEKRLNIIKLSKEGIQQREDDIIDLTKFMEEYKKYEWFDPSSIEDYIAEIKQEIKDLEEQIKKAVDNAVAEGIDITVTPEIANIPPIVSKPTETPTIKESTDLIPYSPLQPKTISSKEATDLIPYIPTRAVGALKPPAPPPSQYPLSRKEKELLQRKALEVSSAMGELASEIETLSDDIQSMDLEQSFAELDSALSSEAKVLDLSLIHGENFPGKKPLNKQAPPLPIPPTLYTPFITTATNSLAELRKKALNTPFIKQIKETLQNIKNPAVASILQEFLVEAQNKAMSTPLAKQLKKEIDEAIQEVKSQAIELPIIPDIQIEQALPIIEPDQAEQIIEEVQSVINEATTAPKQGDVPDIVTPITENATQKAKAKEPLLRQVGKKLSQGLDLGLRVAGKGVATTMMGLFELPDPRKTLAKKQAVLDDVLEEVKKRAMEIQQEIAKAGEQTAEKAVFVSAGFTGTKGDLSKQATAQQLRRITPASVPIIPVSNKNTDIDVTFTQNPIKWLQKAIGKAGQLGVSSKINKDAIEMAAQVFARQLNNPQFKASLIGHSAGGYVVQEALAMLEKLGVQAKGVSLGTPSSLVPSLPSQGHTDIMSSQDPIGKITSFIHKMMGIKSPAITPQIQSGGHDLPEYLKSRNVIAELQQVMDLTEEEAMRMKAMMKDTVYEVSEDAGTGTQELFDNIMTGIKDQYQKLPDFVKKPLSVIADLGKLAIAGFTFNMLQERLRTLITESTQVALNFQRIRTTVNSMEKGGFEYAQKQAEKLNLDLEKTPQAYQQIVASAMPMIEAGQLMTEDVHSLFEGVTTASRAFNLSADDMQGALLAVGQIMSKGTVQAEELRGQLGERIPGAFQIAAKAMGMTTAQLNKQLSLGNISAVQFAKAFGQQLRISSAMMAQSSMGTASASIQAFQNNVKKIQDSIGSKLIPILGQFAQIGAKALEVLSNKDVLNTLLTVGKAFSLFFVGLVIPSVINLATNLLPLVSKGVRGITDLFSANYIKMKGFMNFNIIPDFGAKQRELKELNRQMLGLQTQAKVVKINNIMTPSAKDLALNELNNQMDVLDKKIATVTNKGKINFKQLGQAIKAGTLLLAEMLAPLVAMESLMFMWKAFSYIWNPPQMAEANKQLAQMNQQLRDIARTYQTINEAQQSATSAKAMQEKIKAIKEEGYSGLGVFAKIGDFFNSNIFGQTITLLGGVAGSIIGVAGALMQATGITSTMLATLGGAFATVGGIVAAMGGPVFAIAGLVAAAITGVALLVNKFRNDEFFTSWGDIFTQKQSMAFDKAITEIGDKTLEMKKRVNSKEFLAQSDQEQLDEYKGQVAELETLKQNLAQQKETSPEQALLKEHEIRQIEHEIQLRNVQIQRLTVLGDTLEGIQKRTELANKKAQSDEMAKQAKIERLQIEGIQTQEETERQKAKATEDRIRQEIFNEQKKVADLQKMEGADPIKKEQEIKETNQRLLELDNELAQNQNQLRQAELNALKAHLDKITQEYERSNNKLENQLANAMTRFKRRVLELRAEYRITEAGAAGLEAEARKRETEANIKIEKQRLEQLAQLRAEAYKALVGKELRDKLAELDQQEREIKSKIMNFENDIIQARIDAKKAERDAINEQLDLEYADLEMRTKRAFSRYSNAQSVQERILRQQRIKDIKARIDAEEKLQGRKETKTSGDISNQLAQLRKQLNLQEEARRPYIKRLQLLEQKSQSETLTKIEVDEMKWLKKRTDLQTKEWYDLQNQLTDLELEERKARQEAINELNDLAYKDMETRTKYAVQQNLMTQDQADIYLQDKKRDGLKARLTYEENLYKEQSKRLNELQLKATTQSLTDVEKAELEWLKTRENLYSTEYYDTANQLIDLQMEVEKKHHELIITNIKKVNQEKQLAYDQEKSQLERTQKAQDLITKSIEKQSELLNLRESVNKAIADADAQRNESQLTNTKRALELIKQLKKGELSKPEEDLAKEELAKLGYNAKSRELDLVKKIAELESQQLQQKWNGLMREQAVQRQLLAIELQKMDISARRDEIEARSGVLEAKKAVLDATVAIAEAEKQQATARTEEEKMQAEMAMQMAKNQLLLSQQQVGLAGQNLDMVLSTNAQQSEIKQLKLDELRITQRSTQEAMLQDLQSKKYAYGQENIKSLLEESNQANENSTEMVKENVGEVQKVTQPQPKVKTGGWISTRWVTPTFNGQGTSPSIGLTADAKKPVSVAEQLQEQIDSGNATVEELKGIRSLLDALKGMPPMMTLNNVFKNVATNITPEEMNRLRSETLGALVNTINGVAGQWAV